MVNAFQYDKISWVNPDNVHITLKFFGDTELEKINSISAVLEECSRQHYAFDIHIEDVGIFGSKYDPKVIWFGIRENKNLLDLSEDIFTELETLGYKRDRQNFRPHLTAGRIKKIGDKTNFQKNINLFKGLKIQSSCIDSIALYESILRTSGAEHITIKNFPLISNGSRNE